MSVISVVNDLEALTITVTGELGGIVERVWQQWADPRQFERWWGSPGYPTPVVDHDLRWRAGPLLHDRDRRAATTTAAGR